jgi:predicted PurR-regulated permease PerM
MAHRQRPLRIAVFTTVRPGNLVVRRGIDPGRPPNMETGLASLGSSRRTTLAINDPSPIRDVAGIWRSTAQAATIGIFVLLFIAFLHFGHAFIVPILAAVVVGATFAPLIGKAAGLGIPRWLSALVLVAMLLAVVGIAVTLLAGPVTTLVGRAPEFGAAIKQKLYVLDWPLAALRELQNAIAPSAPGAVKVERAWTELFAPVVAVVTPAASQLVLFTVTFLFYLISEVEVRNLLISMMPSREAKLRVIRISRDIGHNLTGYLALVTVINIGLGAVVALGTWLLGFPYPLVFGLLAAFLNYVPYVGPALTTLILFGVGLAVFPSLGAALIAPLGFIGAATVEGQVIKPMMVGQRLTLNPLAVFINLAFWTWLWGPVGTFLADPLSIIALVVVSHLFPADDTKLPE